MTKDEILAMEPGDGLDRLVHEDVMEDARPWIYANLRYSRTIPSAWLVVEKMPPPFQIHRCLDNTYWVVFGFDTMIKPHIVANTAPEAICKAALLAKLEAGK